MSKSDALRAMREAKYAANEARLSARPKRPAAAAAPVAPPTPAPVRSAAPGDVEGTEIASPLSPGSAADEACGHRNMSGRTCTRERGHAAKSHRYS